MNFQAVTNLGSLMKTTSLAVKWETNSRNPAFNGGKVGQGAKPADVTGLLKSLNPKLADDATQQARTGDIITKLQLGEPLSPAELEYLREHSPAAYEEAKRAMAEKEAYEKALRNCKTKDEVQSLHLAKTAQALSSIKDGMARNDMAACVAANGKMTQMAKVLDEFTATAEYRDMAVDHSQLAEAVKAEREEAALQATDKEEVPVPQEEPAAEAEAGGEATAAIPPAGAGEGESEGQPAGAHAGQETEAATAPAAAKTAKAGKAGQTTKGMPPAPAAVYAQKSATGVGETQPTQQQRRMLRKC